MHRQKSSRRVMSLALVLLCSIGCGSAGVVSTLVPPAATPTPIPPTVAPTLEEGWTLYEKAEEGFAIALPPARKQIDMDPQTLEASLDAVKEQNPEMASMLEGQARTLVTSGIKFFGFDLSPEATAAGFATNVNVFKQSLGAEASLDFYVQLNVGQLENIPNVVEPISHQRVNIAAGEAEQMRYGMEMAAPDGQTVTMALTQYLVVEGKDAYVITLTTRADWAEKYAPIFEQIGQSFRLIQ